MTTVPYDFVNSVAHFLPARSFDPITHLECKTWSHVGHSHQHKRKSYTLAIFLHDDQVRGEFFDCDTKEFVTEEFSSWNKTIDSFTRIVSIAFFDLDTGVLSSDEISSLCHFISQMPLEFIEVINPVISSVFSKVDYLWKREVLGVTIENDFFHEEFVKFHFLENRRLQVLSVTNATYAFMKRLLRTFSIDDLYQDNGEDDEKRFEDLNELGFQDGNAKIRKFAVCKSYPLDRQFVLVAHPASEV
ncbi:hypothetical protein L596_009855 [Steinernema carpocapsae]|uniref:Uncharacterized protein n=1 Tax=Steinernema carpocapsae TaxID=34508 RepID=A0A4U5PGJ4_STECR|nr:hypothetical protein L596_009855 [Steinernema carpocapsae]